MAPVHSRTALREHLMIMQSNTTVTGMAEWRASRGGWPERFVITCISPCEGLGSIVSRAKEIAVERHGERVKDRLIESIVDDLTDESVATTKFYLAPHMVAPTYHITAEMSRAGWRRELTITDVVNIISSGAKWFAVG